MEREKIKLTPSQHMGVCTDGYYAIDGKNVIKIVEEGYDDSKRHTEEHHVIFKRLADDKHFRVDYETSVKDEMGWSDCNWGDEFEAIEVFPREKITITYE